MLCPKCGCNSPIINSRPKGYGRMRRYQCPSCQNRFTTVEFVDKGFCRGKPSRLLGEKVLCWISVEERLPEPEQGVLVYDDCGYMNIATYTHDKYFPTLYEFHVNGEYEPGITHWMPLPEKPKEE